MKNLTDEFIVFRNNAVQRRRFRASGSGSGGDFTRISFPSHHDGDDEAGVRLLLSPEEAEMSTPSYAGQCEALQYQLGRLETKIDHLDELHKVHASRPTLDDEDKEEAEIRAATRDVTTMFSSCHHQVKLIRRNTMLSSEGVERLITRNMVNYLVNRLQESTEKFTQSQRDYLKTIKSREEKSKQFLVDFDDVIEEETPQSNGFAGGRLSWAKNDLMVLEANTHLVNRREKEINDIVRSIADLNVIFRDLAGMITEQGAVIDRIDHNIEQTQMKVERGLREIKKAHMYQRKDRKMHCIMILAVIVIVLLIILIVTKT